MTEALCCEGWRDIKIPNSMAISIRRGKFACNSMKYKPKQSLAMTQTTPGVFRPEEVDDGPSAYTLTSKEASKEAWNTIHCKHPPRINKNASTEGIISNVAGTVIPPNEHYSTVARQAKSTICSQGYTKSKPAVGFDRLTANRTNYALGSDNPVLEVTTPASHVHYPSLHEQPPVEQANLGGWHTIDGRYFNDVPMRTTIKRGGAGGSGILGYDFNVVTGAPIEQGTRARLSNTLMGCTSLSPSSSFHGQSLRASRSVKEKTERDIDGWGDSQKKVDMISAKLRPTVVGPKPFDPKDVKRPNCPVLSTRPW